MPDDSVITQHTPVIAEVHILWLTQGLGCDGDTIAITAATQPSIEDVVLGAIAGLPKVQLHNPVLARSRRRLHGAVSSGGARRAWQLQGSARWTAGAHLVLQNLVGLSPATVGGVVMVQIAAGS